MLRLVQRQKYWRAKRQLRTVSIAPPLTSVPATVTIAYIDIAEIAPTGDINLYL